MSALSFSRPHRSNGFTLLEMMITLAIFILLTAAVFGIMTGVLQSSSSLQDNQNRRDQMTALNAFLKKRLGEMPALSALTSYQRGDGEGLAQNGIVFGTAGMATAIDAKIQANGYYTLRTAVLTGDASPGQLQDARQALQAIVTGDEQSITWIPLLHDVKSLDWKFQDFGTGQWADLWNSSAAKPNLVEFSLQMAGDLQPATMDFWLPKIDPPSTTPSP
jgi:prepilin-type N-terminal cleavage/methylation domain-containing protein